MNTKGMLGTMHGHAILQTTHRLSTPAKKIVHRAFPTVTRPTARLRLDRPRHAALAFAHTLRTVIHQNPIQSFVLGISSATLAVAASLGHLDVLSDVATQVAARPEAIAPEAWMLCLLLSSAGRTAACVLACWATAKYFDTRLEDGETTVALLAQRQRTLHRFSDVVLRALLQAQDQVLAQSRDSLREQGYPTSYEEIFDSIEDGDNNEDNNEGGDGESSTTPLEEFAGWYREQLEVQEAALHEIAEAGRQRGQKRRQKKGQKNWQRSSWGFLMKEEERGQKILEDALDSLGMNIDDLKALQEGDAVSSSLPRWNKENMSKSKHEPPEKKKQRQRYRLTPEPRLRSMGGIIKKEPPLAWERRQLERLLHLPAQEDAQHHPAFVQFLQEEREKLERAADILDALQQEKEDEEYFASLWDAASSSTDTDE